MSASKQLQPSLDDHQKQDIKNSRIEELHESLMLYQSVNKKTKTETKSQLPTIAPSTKMVRQYSSLSDNRHLRYLFHQFCKQSYVGGINVTFDQISQSADKMTLNKWMVFCKEFQLTKKLTSREVRLIFRKATNEGSEMDISSFCEALERVQVKANIDQRQLVKNVLHADSHDSARNRICSMKVHFAGPKTNFFMQGTLTEKTRQQEKKVQKVFKEKQQKQFVLIQGKFREQIEREVNQRKKIRQIRNQNLRNRSAIPTESIRLSPQISIERYKNSSVLESSPQSTRSKVTNTSFSSYSKIFQSHKASTTTQNTSILRRGKRQQQIQSKSRLLFQKQREEQTEEVRLRQFSMDEQIEDQVQSVQEQSPLKKALTKQPYQWLDQSDAESDDILKSHFDNQKKIRQNLGKRKKLQESKISQINCEGKEEEDSDFMITKYA